MKLAILNIAGAFGLAVLAFEDLLLVPFRADMTGLTYVIAAGFAGGVCAAFLGRWGAVKWLSGRLPYLGLIGTVLGFSIALLGVDVEDFQDIDKMAENVGVLLSGMGVALYTTLLGAIAAFWLDLCWTLR